MYDNCAFVNACGFEGGTATVGTLEQVESLKKWLKKEK